MATPTSLKKSITAFPTTTKAKRKRSGLETLVQVLLEKANIPHEYETVTLRYTLPASVHRYIPDFPLSNLLFLESKGRWQASDRKKLRLIKEQHPDKTVLMVFGRSENTLSKQSKTTYGDYCDKYGLLWCDIEEFKKNPKATIKRLVTKGSNANTPA